MIKIQLSQSEFVFVVKKLVLKWKLEKTDKNLQNIMIFLTMTPNLGEDDDSNFEQSDSDSDVNESDVDTEFGLDDTAEAEQEKQDQHIWYSDVLDIQQFPFAKEKTGIQNNIVNENSTPRDAFNGLFSTDVVDQLVRATNKYGKTLYNSKPLAKRVEFQETNQKELLKFLGLCLLQGQTKSPTIRQLFSKHPLYYRPVFSATMSGRRFETILRCFNTHSDPNISTEPSSDDRLIKVRPLLDTMIQRFSAAYSPDKELSLDESLLLW